MFGSDRNNGGSAVVYFLTKNLFIVALLLTGLAAVSFLVASFSALDAPIQEHGGEIYRDYLIARQISEYKEFVLTGPWNGFLGAIKNSPLYYYVLAIFISVYDDPIFLNMTSVMFFSLTILLVYFIGKNLFGPLVGLLASVFFALSPGIVSHARYIWMPSVMLPVVNSSYLLLILSYRKKSFRLLLAAIITFATAIALHNSVIPLVPLFAVLVIIILGDQKKTSGYYIYSAASFIATLAVLYLPVAFYLAKINYSFGTSVTQNIFISSWGEFSTNLINNLSLFTKDLFRLPSIFSSKIWAALGGIVLVSYGLISRNDTQKKQIFYITLAFAAQPLVLASIVNTSRTISGDTLHMFAYYFLPIFSSVFVLVAELINSVLSKYRILYAIKFLLVLVLVEALILNIISSSNQFNMRNYANIASAVSGIESAINEIRYRDNLTSLDFFQIKAYDDLVKNGMLELVFWAPLEKRLGTRFFETKDDNRQYHLLNSGEYIFLVCLNISDRRCKDNFLEEHKNYAISKMVYSKNQFNIYLAAPSHFSR